jgi:hypothetical protein
LELEKPDKLDRPDRLDKPDVLHEEGLRKAKESYFPHHMVDKYTVTLTVER